MRSLLAAAALLRYLLCWALNALSGRVPDLVVKGLALIILFLLRLRPRPELPEDPEVFLAQHGVEVRLVPHEIISDHLACYNIALWGVRIRPRAARRLGIPSGQVWMSEALRPWRHFVLFHEVAEVIFRARGFHGLAGHQLAEEEELLRWHSDLSWLDMNARRPWPRRHLVVLAELLRGWPSLGRTRRLREH